MIVLASMFRDAEGYIDRYFSQIEGLREFADVTLVVAEGDSTDNTYNELKGRLTGDDILVKLDHGGKRYGSVDHPQRWADIASVVKVILQNVSKVIHNADAFVWIESDLVWTPSALAVLIDDVRTVPAVAPMVFDGPH